LQKMTEYIVDTRMNYKSIYWVLLLFSLIIYVLTLNSRDLVSGDETRVAGISSQIALQNNWVKPELNGTVFLEKPPLFFWNNAVTLKIFGRTPFAARLPSALMAVFGILGLFWLLKHLGFSLTGALASTIILATSAQFWEYGHKCMIDMMLAVFIEFAVLGFAVFCTVEEKKQKIFYFSIFTLALSGAIFSKGLVGLAIPALGIGAYLFTSKVFLKKGESWTTCMFFFVGALIAFIPVSVWILFLYRQSGYDAVYTIVWTNNFGRFTGSHPEHVEPFYYYLKKFPAQLAPWTFLLPPAFIYHFLQLKKSKSKISLFFLSVLVVPYLLLSISAGKRQVYLLPLYAFQAALIGNMLGALPEFIAKSKYGQKICLALKSLAYLLLVLFPITAIVCIVFGYMNGIRAWLILPILLFLLSIATILMDIKGKRKQALAMSLISLALLFASIDCVFISAAKKKYSYCDLFSYIQALEKHDDAIPLLLNSHEKMRGAVVFYLGRTLKEVTEKDLMNMQKLDASKYVFIFDTGKHKKLPAKFKNMHIIKAFKIGKKYTMLLSLENKQPPTI